MSVADYFLKIEGIEGECKDVSHKGEMQIVSFSKEAISPRDSATGMASGKRIWDLARFSMRMDKSFIFLVKYANENKLIKDAILVCRKAGGVGAKSQEPGQEYLKITFGNAQMSKVSVRGGKDGDPTPIVDFALNYTKIQEDYQAQTQQGTLSGAVSYADTIGVGT